MGMPSSPLYAIDNSNIINPYGSSVVHNDINIHDVVLFLQTLSWEVSGGIKASECLQVEVYDHESFGNNRWVTQISMF